MNVIEEDNSDSEKYISSQTNILHMGTLWLKKLRQIHISYSCFPVFAIISKICDVKTQKHNF